MTKSDLNNALSGKENLPEREAARIINLLFDGFTDTLKGNGRIEIRGFGSLSVRKYDAHIEWNPQVRSEIANKVEKTSVLQGCESVNREDR